MAYDFTRGTTWTTSSPHEAWICPGEPNGGYSIVGKVINSILIKKTLLTKMNKFIFQLCLALLLPAISISGTINFEGGTWTIQRIHGDPINVKKVEIERFDGGGSILIYTLPDGSEGFVNTSNVKNLKQLLKMAETGEYVPDNQVTDENRRKYHQLKRESDQLQQEINQRRRDLDQELQEMAAAGGGSIRAQCKEKWGTDYSMVKYCIDMQMTAKRKVSSRSGAIRSRCEQKWGTDYSMVEYCIDKQTTAKRKVSSHGGGIRSRCEQKWGADYSMVEYCIDKQTTAKRNIESTYRNSRRRQHCERKWGYDYSMVEYCIEK